MLKYGEPQDADATVWTADARERLIRVFRILLDWEARATANVVEDARHDGDQDSDGSALREGIVQGPGTGGILDPGPAQAAAPVRAGATAHDPGGVRRHRNRQTGGRGGFAEMLAFLTANPSCRTILVEKTDRLYRNIKDWITVDDLDLMVHFVKENAIVSKASRSSEKFMHASKS
jgi:Resolvase, N terminal domain